MTDAPAATSAFLAATEVATELTHLARVFERGFAMLGARGATPAALPSAERVVVATASRVLGEHAAAFAALVPESVLLDAARAAGAARPVDLPPDPAALLGALDASVASLVARAGPVADGALLRHGARARSELAELRAELARCIVEG